MKSDPGLRTAKAAFLAAMAGLATTAATYTYGSGNQIEQLPIVLRSIEPSYLSHDFFVNSASGFGPRFYFAEFIAAVAGSPSRVPAVYLALTALSNVAVSLVTFFFARALYAKSDEAGLLASAAVMSVTTFPLGFCPAIYHASLVPAALGSPWIFAGIFASVRGRLVLGSTLCGIASIFHPLFGLEAALLSVACCMVTELATARAVPKRLWGPLLLSMLLIALFSALSLIPYASQPRISSEHFVRILAEFRHPHHYVPSTFSPMEYLSASAYLGALLIAGIWWRTMAVSTRKEAVRLLVLGVLILTLCVAGFFFVEVVPLRIWVTAQPFRLLYLLKWLGLVLMAGIIADRFHRDRDQEAGLFLVGLLHPLATGIAFLSQWLRAAAPPGLRFAQRILQPSTVVFLSLGALVAVATERHLFAVLHLTVATLICFPRKYVAAAVPLGAAAMWLAAAVYWQGDLPDDFRSHTRVLRSLSLQIGHHELGEDGAELAGFARRHTPADSLFLTPPNWGQFRLVADRAVVVDWKAFPFQDSAMAEWYQRLANCYGPFHSEKSLPAEAAEIRRRYQRIRDGELETLHDLYGISHAVLHSGTPTRFPTLFENRDFKLVKISADSLVGPIVSTKRSLPITMRLSRSDLRQCSSVHQEPRPSQGGIGWLPPPRVNGLCYP